MLNEPWHSLSTSILTKTWIGERLDNHAFISLSFPITIFRRQVIVQQNGMRGAGSNGATAAAAAAAAAGNNSNGASNSSKFCHECGSEFPVQWARFCSFCGDRRVWWERVTGATKPKRRLAQSEPNDDQSMFDLLIFIYIWSMRWPIFTHSCFSFQVFFIYILN